MNVLWRFAREHLDDGASRVHSIGELRFNGAASDHDWRWYEAACNEVLDDLALTATCLYNMIDCPASALAMVTATHDVAELDGARLPHGRTAPATAPARPPVPRRWPDVELLGLSKTSAVRATLRDADGLDPDVVERASLVFSELVANAVVHGGGVADVELWFDRGHVAGRVTDHGPGIEDSYATTRTPKLGQRGVGLWVSHLEATRLVVEPNRPTGTTATALIAPG
jgi:anti-sigma regulatory factor (Ser/Thr protein kinase)